MIGSQVREEEEAEACNPGLNAPQDTLQPRVVQANPRVRKTIGNLSMPKG